MKTIYKKTLSWLPRKFLLNQKLIGSNCNCISDGLTSRRFFSDNYHDPKAPLDIEGYTRSEYLRETEHHSALEAAVGQLFKGDPVIEGIEMAYSNYIDALVEKDTIFLQDICERAMGDKIVEYLEANKSFEVLSTGGTWEDPNEAISDKVRISKLVFAVGLSTDRKRNQNLRVTSLPVGQGMQLYVCFPTEMGNSMMSIASFTFRNGSAGGKDFERTQLFNNTLMRIECFVKSNHAVTLASDNTVQGPFTYHKIILEAPMNGLIDKVASGGIGGLMSFASVLNQSSKVGADQRVVGEKFIEQVKELLVPAEYDFVITDVDGFMDGNPFGESA
jgi:hypothetical protein